MDETERALEYHDRGFNCAQCVLAACGEVTGLPEKSALAVAGGFGGGLACGEICGALSGAVMALGMVCPHTQPFDPQAKGRARALAADACERFRGEYGCLTCRELLELVGDKSRCREFIAYGAQLVTELAEENL